MLAFLSTLFVTIQAVWPSFSYANESLCAPLPSLNQGGPVVTITAEEASTLPSVVAQAAPGTTILLSDGVYKLNGKSLVFRASNMTLRAASGKREAVVLDGQYNSGIIIQIGAPHITIADITIRRNKNYHIEFVGNGSHALLYNLHLLDAAHHFFKIGTNDHIPQYNDFGTVACSLFELTHEGRGKIEALNEEVSCIVGGIEAYRALGWHVRDNVFRNIHCTNGEHANYSINFSKTSKDTLIERNTILNCARGIGFGVGEIGTHRDYDSSSKAVVITAATGHVGGVIRNNIIFGHIGDLFNVGISLEHAVQASVYHNTVISTGGTFSSIDTRFFNSDPMIVNNLIRPRMTIRDRARPNNIGNIEIRSLTLFEDPMGNNLHLLGTAIKVINKGIRLNDLVVSDIDGEMRDDMPDVGADEYVSSPLP